VEPRLLGRCRVGRQGVSPACLDLLLTFLLLLSVSSRAEPAGPLLVHLRPRGHSIDGEVDELLGFNQVYDLVRVRVDVPENLLFALRLGPILWVGAGMDDAVHVEVQIVHCWVVLLNFLRNQLFSFTNLVILRSNFQIVYISNSTFSLFSFKLLFKNLNVFFTQRIDNHFWISYGQPSKKCWDSHKYFY